MKWLSQIKNDIQSEVGHDWSTLTLQGQSGVRPTI